MGVKTMTSDNCIRPGDVYRYYCSNGQSYGIMVPVKTSRGWDLIDTYHLDSPLVKHGETLDEASVRRVIELGSSEHDGYVRGCVFNFYYHNVLLGVQEVPDGMRLLLNLGSYDVVSRRECENYDDGDVVMDIPIYREQHFDWASGRTRGLCFVRDGSERSSAREFAALCGDAWRQLTMPGVGMAEELLEKAQDKLRELEGMGLASQDNKADVVKLKMCIEAIKECRDKVDIACEWRRLQNSEG